MEKLVIATRRSQLALWQSEYIKAETSKTLSKYGS